MSSGSTTTRSVPWDLSFLRVGALVTAVLAAVAALVVGLVRSWPDAVAVVVGAAIVTAFFCLSGLVVAWAGKKDDTWTLPAALGMFFIKAIVLFSVLSALPEDGWLDQRTLAWAVIAGALLWSVVQLRWVWTRQLYYVTPPAPPRPAAAGPGTPSVTRSGDVQHPPAEDPESPATRG